MGYQRKTTQAFITRRTSSTHRSSKVIQSGIWAGAILLGFVSSQKPEDRQLRILSKPISNTPPKNKHETHQVTGFHDHFILNASIHSLNALPSTDPVGGVSEYFFRQRNRTAGHRQNMIVGRVKENQNPIYRSA